MATTPRYRLLTPDELQELEKEFIDFLVVNGITADDWVRLKEEEKEKAEDIVVLFSDMVFERILREARFLEIRFPGEVRTFQCLERKLVLVGMRSDREGVDFTDPAFIEQAAANPPEGIEVYHSEKAYKKKRESELFDMIRSGCYLSDGKLFKALSLSLSSL